MTGSTRGWLLVLAALGTVSCSGNKPVSYSAPVGINLKAKGDDAKSGVITEEKNINTEEGNPYGAFVAAARQELGGVDPKRIEVSSVTLLLGGTSKGVTTLEQVMMGKAEILFVMNDTNDSFPVAHTEDPKGAGPVDLAIDFKSAQVVAEDWSKLLGGSFKVVLRSPAVATFADKKDMDADLQVTIEFAAYE